ncbi:hypothetical protein [Parvicella tangerina]|uniref:Uncharacterized protein n=1 Tax=Parvicella tangerina TaxID=2829795 RepID=A0A916NCE0_9FLAO|nr:hypothetical protein [Parvicella tangerina]CAG5085105.1 hypothetical protein CRYO30217_02651 [Parvicella tangerina]
MRLSKIGILALSFLLFSTGVSAQLIGKKKNETEMETDGKAEFDKGVQEARETARKKLVPYKYDGTKSTYFSYKSYTYAKEVEVVTLEKTDYKICFNSNMVTADKIGVKIYDKPQDGKGRILLYEKEDIGGNEFEVNLEDLNETFKTKKKEMWPKEKHDLVDKMRLKRLYVNYIIPAVEREMETVEDDYGNQKKTTVIQYSAIVLAVGYLNL